MLGVSSPKVTPTRECRDKSAVVVNVGTVGQHGEVKTPVDEGRHLCGRRADGLLATGADAGLARWPLVVLVRHGPGDEPGRRWLISVLATTPAVGTVTIIN